MKLNYCNKRWRRARRAFLDANPLCVMCMYSGRTTPASVVDHIIPHQGDVSLYWDRTNWQALCKACHDGVKQVQDLHGTHQACDVSGMPIDPSHRWADEKK